MSMEQWGIGRPDYSVNVEKSVQPIIRSHQNRIVFTQTITGLSMPVNVYVLNLGTFTSDEIGRNVAFHECSIDVAQNILIRAYCAYFDSSGNRLTDIYGLEYGYGKIEFKYNRGISFTARENTGIGIAFKHYDPETTTVDYTIKCFGIIEPEE